MGVSTDGLIFYGFTFSEDGYGEPEWMNEDSSEEWLEHYMSAYGIEIPVFDWDSYDRNKREEWVDRERWEEWYELKRRWEESCAFEIGYHCSGDYPMYYVALKRTVINARRGYPREIDWQTHFFEIMVDERREFEEFCRRMDIEWQEPKWYLASIWD